MTPQLCRLLGVEEVDETHRRVNVHVRVRLREAEEVVVLRHAHVRDDGSEVRMPRQDHAEWTRAGVRAGRRSAAGMYDDRHTCVGQHAPDVVEQGVTRVEATYLHMHLEDRGA